MTLSKSMQKYFAFKKATDEDDDLVTPTPRERTSVPPPAMASEPPLRDDEPVWQPKEGRVSTRRPSRSWSSIDPRGGMDLSLFSSDAVAAIDAATSPEERREIMQQDNPTAVAAADRAAARNSGPQVRVRQFPTRRQQARDWTPQWKQALRNNASQMREIIDRVGSEVSGGQSLQEAFSDGSTPDSLNDYWSELHRNSSEQLGRGPSVGGLMIANHGKHVLHKLSEDVLHPIFSALDDGTPIEEIFGSNSDETLQNIEHLKSQYGSIEASRWRNLATDKSLQRTLGINDQLFKYLAGYPAELNGRTTPPVFGEGARRLAVAANNPRLFGEGNPNLLARIGALMNVTRQ